MGLNWGESTAALGLNPLLEICLSGSPVGTPSKRPSRCIRIGLALLSL